MEKLYSRYDDDATDAREVITAAMRTDRGKPVARPMKDLTNASDQDFRRDVERYFDPALMRLS